MEHKSHIDPNRKTVGAISNEIRSTDTKSMLIGDINHEMLKGFIDDINQALEDGRKEFSNQDFYVLVTEKWEYQMKNALIRKVALFKKRPYPEANTICFKYDHNTKEVLYCWDLPMRHEMWNVKKASAIFEPQIVADIEAWENNEMEHFGLMKDDLGQHWIENPHFKDRRMGEEKTKFRLHTL
jgi:hypothetical protein